MHKVEQIVPFGRRKDRMSGKCFENVFSVGDCRNLSLSAALLDAGTRDRPWHMVQDGTGLFSYNSAKPTVNVAQRENDKSFGQAGLLRHVKGKYEVDRWRCRTCLDVR